MSHLSHKIINYFLYPVFIILGLLAVSCEKKMPVLPKSDLLTLPSLTVKNFNTVLNDSGRIQLTMTSPLLEQYDKADPHIPNSERE
jgi:hypothetical protein